jgi:protein CpxP
LHSFFEKNNPDMKKIFMMALGLLFAVSGAMAQEKTATVKPAPNPEVRAEKFTKRMTRELGLDAAQQERVKGINLDRFKQLSEARATNAGDKKAVQQKVKEINDLYFQNLKAVLTPEQFAKFQTLKEEMKEKAFQKKKG